ncbi:hypothetical protein [Treponema sp. Marseille-Q3903]|uniref:MuF-C-terminal domain-containing protein n=1 Tax=Treponema sp. Marseille-Q3903 TaxID=2766703 RepID=UPI001652B287|nr:hypothetical protein [Treponema sp. Marseille-Q3903]MBC6713582.1 hypothetical protein [Treponema sp. Marseille-Q3903]
MVNERDLEKLKDILKEVLKEKAEELPRIEFSQKSYDALFPRGRIQTPIENVKLGSHQFEKLDAKKRQFILGAVHEVLHTPDLIIDELRKNVFGTEEKSHIYAKSYLIANKSKGIQSVVVVIGNDNVSISTHEKDINNLVNKIKMPEQILYKSSEIGQLISQRIQKEQSIANPTVATNDYDNIVSQSEKISTEKIQFQINSIQGEKTMANENTQAMENTNEELLTPEQFLKNLCARADIEVIEDTSIMRSILDAGKNVQKMAVKYGTNQDIQNEESFNGFGTYVVSVNEENAKQLGIKIAARKYGGTFYINDQPFNEFLQEKNFSPYWTKRLEQFKGNDIDSLTSDFINADVKGNAALQKEHEAITTLFSLDLIEYKREQTFLYSVDIPDNDNTNYLLYNNPIGIENANRINEQLEKLNVDWRVSRNDIGKNIYFDVLAKNVFKGNQKQTSEFLKNCGYVGMQMDSSNYIVFNDRDMSISNRVQYMIDGENNIYGFAYDGKIYADPEIATSNTYAHEFTHLWDSYTQNKNPELWQKGKDIFKGTSLWEEVLADENYRNLSNDDEILSECHARIVGKMAEAVLNKIAEKDGGLKKDQVIDWDKECQEYIANELLETLNINPELGSENYISDSVKSEYLKEFLAQPMKDLTDGVKITENVRSKNIQSMIETERQENKDFFNSVENYMKNGVSPRHNEFLISETPKLLQFAGIDNNEILMTTKVINKAKNENHNLTDEEILNALKGIFDPIVIFNSDKDRSEAKNNSVLIFTEAIDKNNNPLVIGFEMSTQKKGDRFEHTINQIHSIHTRSTLINSKGENMLQKWTEKGLMKYVDDKKISGWLEDRQIQFLLTLTKPDEINITDSAGNVKSFSVKTKSGFENAVVAVGVAPTITTLRNPESLGSTRLNPSPTTVNQNIPYSENMSSGNIQKQVEPIFPKIIDHTEPVYANSDKKSGDHYYVLVSSELKNQIASELRNLNPGESLVVEYRKWTNTEESEYDFFASIMQRNGDEYEMVKSISPTEKIQTTKLPDNETTRELKEKIKELAKDYDLEHLDPIEALEDFHNNNPFYTPPTAEKIQAEKEAHEAYIQRELDKTVEQLQANGGMSDTAIEADIAAQENARADYIDADGNPHWYDEEEPQQEVVPFFYDTYNNPHDPIELYEVIENFSKIESEKWNLSPEDKVAVVHLIDVSQIKGNDKDKTIENLNNYLLSEEYNREESSYAKILTPVLLSYNQENKNFDFAFSTDEIKEQELKTVEIPEKKGEIKSIIGNVFTGGNVKATQDFQDELIEKGLVKAEDEFILVNELEANVNGTKVKENQPYVMLTTPVEVDGIKRFVGTKYYHVSSLEEPQKIEKKTEPENKEQDKSKTDKDVIIYGKTKVPEFAMMTNHGFENFKNMIVDSREESSNSYLLKSEDGKNSVRVTAATLKELMSEPYQAKAKSYNDEMKIQDKMIESQYQDFFKQRSNCANNFRHNLSVYCRKEANSPLDSLKIANSLIKQMSKEEKHKTKELLKTLRKEGQSINEVLIETYNGAVKEVPLNEEYLNNKRYDKMIARPMYDTFSSKGEKIDRDFDLRIGDSVKIQFKADKVFGKGKESVSSEVTIISSSKEGNLVTLMDGKKSFYDVPRDTFLKEYAHQEIKERKAQAKEFKHHSMRMEIGR